MYRESKYLIFYVRLVVNIIFKLSIIINFVYQDTKQINTLNYFSFFSYYLTQKKTLEINPRHPLMKELLRRVEEDPEDPVSKNMALMMFQTGKYLQLIVLPNWK